jgi:hypothetical protein
MSPGGIRQLAARIRFAGIPAGLEMLRQAFQHEPTAVRLLSLAVQLRCESMGWRGNCCHGYEAKRHYWAGGDSI